VEDIYLAWNAFYNRSLEELREGIEKVKKELQHDESLWALESCIQK
jgi:hypothetical protein